MQTSLHQAFPQTMKLHVFISELQTAKQEQVIRAAGQRQLNGEVQLEVHRHDGWPT